MIKHMGHARTVRRTSPLFRLGVALLVVVFVALTIVAAARSDLADAVVIGGLGAITIAAVLWSERFLSRWVRRRDVV